jgi:DNA-binding PadR family transcriptional regulator
MEEQSAEVQPIEVQPIERQPVENQTVKGHLDLLLLAVVADAPLHGYAVIERLRQRSGGVFDLPEGTVYPALHRLDRAGLLRSEWTVAQGRRRRVYRLTAKGTRALDDRARVWDEFAAAVAGVLEGVRWAPT